MGCWRSRPCGSFVQAQLRNPMLSSWNGRCWDALGLVPMFWGFVQENGTIDFFLKKLTEKISTCHGWPSSLRHNLGFALILWLKPFDSPWQDPLGMRMSSHPHLVSIRSRPISRLCLLGGWSFSVQEYLRFSAWTIKMFGQVQLLIEENHM